MTGKYNEDISNNSILNGFRIFYSFNVRIFLCRFGNGVLSAHSKKVSEKFTVIMIVKDNYYVN